MYDMATALSLFLCSGIIILGIYEDIGRSRQDIDMLARGPITLQNHMTFMVPQTAFGNRIVVRPYRRAASSHGVEHDFETR